MRRRAAAAAALAALLLAACTLRPVAPPPLEPEVLSPARLGALDDRARFRAILCAIATARPELPDARPCEAILHALPDEPPFDPQPVPLGPPRLPLRVVGLPGLAADCMAWFATSFADAFAHLEALGWKTAILPTGSLASVAWNAQKIRAELSAMALAPGERLLLLAHSKAAADVLEALALDPALPERVAAVVTVAGAVMGSPLAEEAPGSWAPVLALLPGARCAVGDGQGVNDLVPRVRRAWLATRPPPPVPVLALGAFAEEDEISTLLRPFWRRLAELGHTSDGQVPASFQIPPGARLLGWLRADHLAVAVPFARRHPWLAHDRLDRNAFPREILFEAVVRRVEELVLEGRPLASPARPG
ncbi:MAG: hypothetical protein RMK81_09985 [Geminicoccaceae bacterium]|nr:hypothetical protein [Geminicoccaceae bacterium]